MMNTFQQFLEAAERDEKAGKEAYDEDARLTLDEQLRLGNFAGPLVCVSKDEGKATFEAHPTIPFDWGKASPTRDVAVLAPGEIAKIKPPIYGKLATEQNPTTLMFGRGSQSDKLDANRQSYLFAPKLFDGGRIISILKQSSATQTWPAPNPPFSPGSVPADATADERAFAACLDDANPIIAIKGPPGTGKTDLLARVALALAKEGKAVGILSTSHAAVDNALERLVEVRGEGSTSPSIQKHKTIESKEEKTATSGILTAQLSINKMPNIWGAVVASATSMVQVQGDELFFKHGKCDVLLLDEAGQIPAYVAAVLSHIAPRMILFGDEDQLPHIAKAAHPPGSHGDSSSMSYIRDVLSPEFTIALEESHRMNNDICGLIQRHFYSGLKHLKAGKNADAHLMNGSNRFPSLIKDAFRHKSPRLSRSQEEVTSVVAWVKRLLQMEVVLEGKGQRPITTHDIAVLTPFRTQARAITQAIRDEKIANSDKLRIGTVDGMQGQGAAVVIYSMASSSTDYIANQAEWLFSSNRWNVAISRAQACAIVVGDVEAHLKALPSALNGIAAQQKIREVMEDGAWANK